MGQNPGAPTAEREMAVPQPGTGLTGIARPGAPGPAAGPERKCQGCRFQAGPQCRRSAQLPWCWAPGAAAGMDEEATVGAERRREAVGAAGFAGPEGGGGARSCGMRFPAGRVVAAGCGAGRGPAAKRRRRWAPPGPAWGRRARPYPDPLFGAWRPVLCPGRGPARGRG